MNRPSEAERLAVIADYIDQKKNIDDYLAGCRRCNVNPERLRWIKAVLLDAALDELRRGGK